jgi:hypothetical protein
MENIEEIENWFKLRELNKELTAEIPTNGIAKNNKIKL